MNIKDKYIVSSHTIGSGYQASVRECIDRATGMHYAVKTIYKSNPQVRHVCIAREAILLLEMKHSSINELVDIYEDDVCVQLVMDLCKGGELFDKICEKSSNPIDGVACFTEGDAARMVYQILNGVRYMHEHDVVHRDLKPENIMFETADKDSPVKIIDFGLARKHSAQEEPMSNICGTPYYIAPEVLRRRYDKSCDLWSVGVIGYVLLCGYPPFNGRENEDIHRAILNGWYCFPSKDWSGTSREALDFIRKLLDMDTSKRMTAEQALNHPWIIDALITDEEQKTVQPEGAILRKRTFTIPRWLGKPKRNRREPSRTYIL